MSWASVAMLLSARTQIRLGEAPSVAMQAKSRNGSYGALRYKLGLTTKTEEATSSV